MRLDHLAIILILGVVVSGCKTERVDPVADAGPLDAVADQDAPADLPSGFAQLNIFKTVDGGVVKSDPEGIDCGGACFAKFDMGSQVRVWAEPDHEHRFAGFGVACTGLDPCVLTMDGNKEVSVTWEPYTPSLAWGKLSASDGADALTALDVTPSGDLLVTGTTTSAEISWGDNAFAGNAETGTFFLARFGADGEFGWQKNFSLAASCGEALVASDVSGNAIVAGMAGDDTDLSGNMSAPSHGSGTFLAQIGIDGTTNWYNIFNGGCIHALSVNAGGEVAITGKVNHANADYGESPHPTTKAANSAFIAVYHSNGLNKWSRVFATADLDYAEGNDLILADDGTVTLVAFFQNTGQVSFGGDILPNGHATVVAGYDAEGEHLFSTPFGGVYSHVAKLFQGPGGGYLAAGWESPGADQENFLATLDDQGVEVARLEFPLEAKQEPVAILPYEGGMFFLGRTFDPYETQHNFFSIRMTDQFVVEYSLDLGGTQEDVLVGARLSEGSDLFLAGSTNSATMVFGDTSLENGSGGKDTPSRAMLLRLTGL